MEMTQLEIAEALGVASLTPATERLVTSLSWSSREVSPGGLYVALVGERADGHDFIPDALARGAACVLASREPAAEVRRELDEAGCALFLVEDCLSALARIAGAWRERLGAEVIGLTGSSGKTTTKQMIAAVLAEAGPTVATAGNQNNELGVPATVLRIAPSDRFAVVEMGMRGFGQIEELCSFVRPSAALVTNVGVSHIELLGSQEGIARAKAEAYASLPAGSTAFLPAYDPRLPLLARGGGLPREGVEAVLFGDFDPALDASALPAALREAPRVRALDVELSADACASFALLLPGGDTARATLRIPGLHQVSNALAAAACGWKAGLSAATIARALGTVEPLAGRANAFAAARGFHVIDDAYNANPDSMAAALRSLSALSAAGRKVAVLGDMGEIGPIAEEAHGRIGRLAASCADALVCVGGLGATIARAASEAGLADVRAFATVDEAIAHLDAALKPGDAVLVKASHSMGFARIVEALSQ